MSGALVFAGGLAALLATGNLLVNAASNLGARFGLSPVVIGLTIVAAGTSAPELAVVGQSVVSDDAGLAIGSILGSNIANILLVLGVAATLGTITVTSRVVRIDIPVMIGASLLVAGFVLDGNLGRLDAAVLAIGFVIFLGWTLRATRAGTSIVLGDAAAEVEIEDEPVWRSITAVTAGIVGLAVSARFVVSGAQDIAEALGLSQLVIGLTVVALGTSAPEVVTTVVATMHGRRDLAVGNAIGSNIFNIFMVLGLSGLFAPDGIAVADDALRLDLPVMLAAAIACLPIVAADHRLYRWEGIMFLSYYVAYIAFVVLEETGNAARDPFAVVMGGFVIPLTLITLAIVIGRRVRFRRSMADAGPSS